MPRVADALVVDDDVLAAADRAVDEVLAALATTPDLVVVFAGGRDTSRLAQVGPRVALRSGAAALVGCTAAGVVGDGRGAEGVPAVSVWAAVLPGARLRTFDLEVLPAADGLAVVGMPTPRGADDPEGADAAVLLLADPYSFPADEFVASAGARAHGLPFLGGLVSGPGRAGTPRLFVDGRVVERGAVGVVLGGDVSVQPLVAQGCRPVGPTMTVTAADGPLLVELAGRPALMKVREVLAGLDPEDQALATTGLHVGLAVDEYAEEHELGAFLVRPVLGVEPARGAVAVGEAVELGRTVRLHVRDAETAREDLRRHLRAARRGRLRTVDGALLFTCTGRGARMLGSSAADVVAVRDGLGGVPVAGFFAAGEIGPVGSRSHLHGFTASVLAVGA